MLFLPLHDPFRNLMILLVILEVLTSFRTRTRLSFKRQINGTTSTSDSIKDYVNELKETVQPFVLDETPTVLSIGRRCMKMGYSFHWMCEVAVHDNT